MGYQRKGASRVRSVQESKSISGAIDDYGDRILYSQATAGGRAD